MSRRRRVATGLPLLALGCAVVFALDVLVLGMSTGYFGGGYNSPRLSGAGAWLAFVAGGALLDAFLITAGFAIAFALARTLRLAGLPRITFAAGLAVLVPVTLDVVSHQLHRVFGRVLGLDVLIELAGGSVSGAVLTAISEAPGALLGLVAAGAGVALAVAAARRLETRLAPRELAPPALGKLAALAAATALCGGLLLHVASQRWPVVAYGLERKPSGLALRTLVRTATDWDRDGFGWLSRPTDRAPLDPAIHPFAVEIPGNGIDENGVGGDRPADWRMPSAPPVGAESPAQPSFLLIFLESFRGDLIGRKHGGQPVTPSLERLAALGSLSQRAFAHNPSTWISRAQLFQGRIRPVAGAPTLIDDFKRRGYRVAYVSGQDDTHGGPDLVGFERADFFVDARSSPERRTSRTALTVSLQVSWRVVLEQVRAYLESTRDDPRPVFLYMNLVDTHFPYHHAELEPLLGVIPVSRAEIRAWNAGRVFETYLQAAANVDRAIGELLALWHEHVGDSAVLVTADHGQAFYEDGMLGHGQSLADEQTRIPLVVKGIRGDWPEPLGLAELRGRVLAGLSGGAGGASFAPDPERELFQFTGSLARPREIALRSSRGLTVLDLATGQARLEGADGGATPLPTEDARLRELVWTWESVVSDEP